MSESRARRSIEAILTEIREEVARAQAKHRPMASAHEGLAVILEEYCELQAEVFKGGGTPRDWPAMRKEALQVAAMAIRLIKDVIDPQCARAIGIDEERSAPFEPEVVDG